MTRMMDVTGFHFVDSIATPGGFVEVKDSHSIEFVALKTRDIVDPLTHVVCENAARWLKACGAERWKKTDSRVGALVIDDKTNYTFTFTATYAITPVLSVFGTGLLMGAESVNSSMSAIAISNTLTSVFLGLCTKATRTGAFKIMAARVQALSCVGSVLTSARSLLFRYWSRARSVYPLESSVEVFGLNCWKVQCLEEMP